MKRIQSTISRALGRRRLASSAPRPTRFAVLALAVLLCSFLIAVPTVFVAGNMQKGAPATPPGQKGPDNGITLVPQVGQCVAFGETIPVRDFEPAQPEDNKESRLKPQGDRAINQKNEERVKQLRPGFGDKGGSGIQNSTLSEPKIPAPIVNFDGNSSDENQTAFGFRVEPPDTNGDVGPNHYMQATNLLVRVFNKNGTPATAAFKMSSLFASIGAPCATRDDGDPIVLYDQLADRWLLSQFCTASQGGRTSQLIAISKTGDPTGAYFVYNFIMPNAKFNDYPHFGVWPDAYYMADNQFTGNSFTGAGAFAFDRAKLLVGDPTATFIYFDEFLIDQTLGGQLPTDLDGYVTPPAGTPNLFMEFRATEFGDPADALRIFAFQADFVNPLSSTFTQVGTDLGLAAFDARNPAPRTDIEQPPPATGGQFVDSIADRLMHRLGCRILSGGVQSYVGNFTVNVSGANPTTAATFQAGIKWFELRRNAGTGAMSILNEGIYAPGAGDGVNGRNIWMAGIAQDGEGNLGLGFSASSLSLFPSVLYTGRFPGDPAGTMAQGEATIVSGAGSQQDAAARWGDYSSMSVDPADDCTFWYTQEYYANSGQFDWKTRIGSFKVNTNCVASQRGIITGTVTNCSTGLPIQNATVSTPDGFFRQTNASGQFSITAAPGTYTVIITAPGGFGTCTTNNVVVTNGGNTIVNCCLAPASIIVSAGATLVAESCTPPNGVLDPGEQVTVSFCVQNTGAANTTSLVGTLANTGGVIGASGPQNYGVVVAGGPPVCRNFTFTAAGACGGTVTASIQFQDGATDLGTLTYTFTLGTLNTIFTENFDTVVAPALPAGWAATQGVNVTGAAPWVTSNAGTPAPPADTAPNALFTSDPNNILDNRIDTPAINVPAAAAVLTFRHNYDLEATFDGGVVEISINAGAFADIITAGGSFVGGTRAYDGPISAAFGSPIAGRQAFTGSSAGFVTTSINLPAGAQGQPVVIRFRFGADNSVSDVGWRVDTVRITAGFVCSTTCAPAMCTAITCPANIARSNDPNQCGAVVTYPAPTAVGSGCGTITCSPASGSFYPVGTTTVTCTAAAGPTCTFSITVVDTQPPTITCPANVTAVTDQNSCPSASCLVVNFPAPVASDNCPGVVVVCNPAAGSCFPVGGTTVTCTATDASGNTATCSFPVTIFDVALQDDSDPSIILLWNSITGSYRFCCNGTIYIGVGKSTVQGCVFTLQHNPADRRVLGRVDKAVHAGSGSIQAPPGTTRCTITDRNTLNDTLLPACQ